MFTIMKNKFKKLATLLAFVVCSCSFDGDLQDPNQLPATGADVDYLMNLVQLNFADFFNNAQGSMAPLVRYTAMTAGYRYQTAYQPQFQDGLWSGAYQGIFVQNKTLIPLAEEKNLTTHVAVAKIINAYTLLTLVDLFGDVPWSEALQGDAGTFSPVADPASDVYDAAIVLLGEAKTELAKTGSDAGAALARDIFYAGNRAKWTALANTLELKAWVNISMIATREAEADAKITSLLTANIIDTPAEDFYYRYGTATVPDSRHPLYNQYYGPSAGSAGGYLSTFFMYDMYFGSDYTTDGVGTGSPIQDPRWRYYFYRQVGSINPVLNGFDQKALGCTPGAPPPHYVAGEVKMFCVFEPGFYGRDHGDASGTPPDAPVITCAGVYPAGGRPDNTNPNTSSYSKPTVRGDGANGAGILPIWMSSFTDYLKSEIEARNGNTANAKTLLLTAITNSISSVKNFADVTAKQSVTFAPWTATTSAAWTSFVDEYKTAVGLAYDAAGVKTDIIGREFWKALWGNGLEACNVYRRTSAPRGMQPTIQTNPGPWMRTLVYPSVYVNLNDNAVQRDPNVVNKVFWDTNSETLN
jgi:hypothetical protein